MLAVALVLEDVWLSESHREVDDPCCGDVANVVRSKLLLAVDILTNRSKFLVQSRGHVY